MERVKKLFVNKIFKGGLVLTLSTLVSQGLAFFLAFYFANEMGNQGFGDFTLYMQVLSVINIVGSLNLNACVIRGRHEFEDNYRSFFYTISILGTVSIVVISGLFFFILSLASRSGWISTGLPFITMGLLIIHSILLFIFNINASRLSGSYRHSELGGINIVKTIFTYIVVFAFFKVFEFSPAYERICATILVLFFTCLYFIKDIEKNEIRSVKREYLSFALAFSTPLIVHSLSSIFLSFFDSICLKYVELQGVLEVGTQGVYSFAYKLGAMITVLWGITNKLWTPWFFDNMKKEKFEDIKHAAQNYIFGFSYICFMFLMLLPETRRFVDSEQRLEAFNYIPIIAFGCYFIFLYSFLSNIEFYHKKVKFIPIGSLLAVMINVVLNVLYIPRFGAWAAAGTTLVSYVALLIFHIILNDFILKNKIFSYRIYTLGIVLMTGAVGIYYTFLDSTYIRIGILLLSMIILLIFNKRKIKWLK